jgi:putative membrane-bound dehydrogenase-like protein
MRFLILGCLASVALAGDLEEAAKLAELPSLVGKGGAHWLDLNGDGHKDWVVSNGEGFGVYLFNPVDKPGVQWKRGWTEVLREGRAGEPAALPDLRGASVSKAGLVTAAGTTLSFEDLRRVPMPKPMSPSESLASQQLESGWRSMLAAAEPLVEDPVFIDWDEQGRAWVVEMGDYPFAPGETTKNGEVGQGLVSARQQGRIKILTDHNGDGVYDQASLFLDGLRHPTGLACWRGGVVISAIPEVFFAKDRDGDGRADFRETLITGFTAGNPQHLVNGFCWGLDGWLHAANGDSGGDLLVMRSGRRLALGTHDFRLDPRSGEVALEFGRSQYGRWRDDYGNWFGNNNSTMAWHYDLPLSWVETQKAKVSRVRSMTQEDKSLYPISPAVRRFNWAAAVNVLTSGCSPIPWEHDGQTDLLVCEPANQLVHRQRLDLRRMPITSRRANPEAKREFWASRDPWSRPVMAREGPDGALYVVDFYRLVLEHPEWIPANTARGLDLRAGESQGRIYRLVGPQGLGSDLPLLKDPVQAIAKGRRWVRDTAQRLLLEAGEPSVVPRLVAVARDDSLPLANRLQAAWSAHLLEPNSSQVLEQLMRSSWPKVRGFSLVAAGFSPPAQEAESWQASDRSGPRETLIELPRGAGGADRDGVIARYLGQLKALKGDSSRGQSVHERVCAACHRLGGRGVELGPDLGSVAGKSDEVLLEAIFDPDRAFEARYQGLCITQKGGVLLEGLLVAETPSSLILRLPGGAQLPVERSSIVNQKLLPRSLMPRGLESVLSAQDVADLLARMRRP